MDSFKHLALINNSEQIISKSCIQSSQGEMWFSYKKGILKYDGYDFSFISAKSIFKSPIQNNLSKMSKDSKGNIWLLSYQGIVSKYITDGKFIPVSLDTEGKIINIFCLNEKVFFVTDNGNIFLYSNSDIIKILTLPSINQNSIKINSLALSKANKLYIATTGGNIFIYSLHNKELNKLDGDFLDYPNNLILTFDQNDNLWIGTETSGLFVFDTRNNKFIQNELITNSLFNLSEELFISIYCDSKGIIWAGTDGSGLYKINPNNKQIISYKSLSNNKYSLSSNTIMDIQEDKQKNLWVITNYGDINILPHGNNKIYYQTGSDDTSPQRILTIYVSKNKDIWLGTDGNGITKIITKKNEENNTIQFFKNTKDQKGFYVQSITEDANGNIWMGTYKNGLWVLDSKSQRFNKIPIFNSKKNKAIDVRTVFTDSKKRIWVGSNISVNVYSNNKKLLASFENNKHGLVGSIAESFAEDKNGNIWIGYDQGGLFKFNEKINDFKHSQFNRIMFYHNKKLIYLNGVKDMVIDNEFIWFINLEGKLFKFTNIETPIQLISIIPSSNVERYSSVNIDNQKNIWLGSSNGITRFNPKDSSVVTYFETDGLQSNIFLSRSSFLDNEGTLYFGSNEGLNYFNPLNITKQKTKGKLYINNIKILNQPADSLIPKQFTGSLTDLKHINLKYNQSSFSFKFSAIGDVLNPNYFYQYKLVNFDRNWIATDQNRTATYTNIPPDDYTFVIKAGDEIGTWNIPSKSIKITIDKPWWKHPLFYLFNLSIILVLLYLGFHWFNMRKKMITKELIYRKDKELQNLKMNFFTKMSHEIQTPLTLIFGPLEDMMNRSSLNGDLLLNQRLNIISNSVKRLSKIAFELTTVRDVELKKLKLLVKKNDLYNEIRNISLSFKEEARIKKIDFTTNCPKNLDNTWYDKDKIEHIIYNLLSNAFKFTPKNGNIQLNVIPIESKNTVKISITDSGHGIPPDELKDIFTLFYQSKIGKKLKGSGVGLTLTKELIDLHHGKIEVTSTKEEGTCFTITLPVAEKNYLDAEKIMTETVTKKFILLDHDKQNVEVLQEIDKNKKTILVVEDNFELRLFLCELLENNYNIILAENGEEGFYYAKNKIPDLILSDIMMPVMNGIKMCDLLQNDSQTNHIPIILITAKNSLSSKIQGLKSGAIEYINKPFNTTELQLKIRNIITSKEQIITKFKKETICNPDINIEKTQDEIFLENLISAINLRFDDTNFKLEDLADALHMSYSTLYRKCQAILGKNLVDFIRLFRLKKGAVVIAKYGYSISETAYMVGFNDPKYFSRCFKKEFGKSPRLFRIEANKMGIENYLKNYNLEDIV